MPSGVTHVDRDLQRGLEKALGVGAAAQRSGIDLLVLPNDTLGSYLGDMGGDLGSDQLPTAIRADAPQITAIAAAAGPVTVCLGYTEAEEVHGDPHYFSATVCVNGDGVLGRRAGTALQGAPARR